MQREKEASNGATVKVDRPLRGMPHPFDKLHPRMYAAEFAGTALLVFLGLSIVIAMWGHDAPFASLPISPGVRRLITGRVGFDCGRGPRPREALVRFDLNFFYEPWDEEGARVIRIRIRAVSIVPLIWRDAPDTRIWLKTRAVSDESCAVRQAAVQELARG
jgi:hypothetical protein